MPFAFNPLTGRLDYYQTSSSSAVLGPATATDNAVARFDGTTGKLIQNSVVIVSDAGDITGVAALTMIGILNTGSGQVVKYTNPGAYPYDILSTDYYVSVDSTSARTIRLPNAPTTATVYVVKDRSGLAATNNITVTTVGGVVTIDGATSKTINVNYGSLSLIFNGTSYEIW